MQRHSVLFIASRICASVGRGFLSSSAFAVMIWPFWQNPHCGTCSSIQACCIGCSRPFAARPSSVVISPFTEDAGTRQDGTAAPLMITLHARHCPRPHPNRGPWSPRSLRRTYSKGVAESTSTECDRPLTFSSILLIGPCSLFGVFSCARVNRSAGRDQYQRYSGERSVSAGQHHRQPARTFPCRTSGSPTNRDRWPETYYYGFSKPRNGVAVRSKQLRLPAGPSSYSR